MGYEKKQRFESNLAEKITFFVKVANYPALKRQKQGIKRSFTTLPINKIQSKKLVVTTTFKNPVFYLKFLYNLFQTSKMTVIILFLLY